MLFLRVIAMLAAIASHCFANEEALIFEHEPWDVQIFEGVNETVSFRCNASSKSNDLIYYRWYFRPPNGTFIPLEDEDNNELMVKNPSKANHGYYLCQAYNYMGSIQSRAAELYVLCTSITQLSFMANFSINWFEFDEDDQGQGSGNQRINITDCTVIQAALKAVLNSSNITVKLGHVINRPGGSEVEAEILSLCDDCNFLNYSLDTIKNKVMSLYSEFTNLVEHINVGLINSDFMIVSSNTSVIRMKIVMAAAENVSMECPQAMSIFRSGDHFFVCVNCKPGHYVRGSTCVPCGLDRFQDKQGQKSCKQCPPGSFTNGIGSTSVEECIGESSRFIEDDDDGGVIAGVVVPVVFVIIMVVAVIIYMVYKGYRRKKEDSTVPPTIIIQNSVAVPIANKFDDGDADDEDNLSEIPTICYEKPSTASQSVKKSSKARKNHKSERVIRRSQEVYKWNRSYSVAQVKNKYPNGSRIPSCYPIGEYVGSLSDNEGEYDHVVSPSGTAKRRSMSISDLTSALKDIPSYSLQIPPNFLGNVHAKRGDLHRLNSKPKSSPPTLEMDDEMSDLYDTTLRRDRSNTIPSHEPSNVRLSGMTFSLNGHCNSESAPKITKRESSSSVKSARPVTQYVNSEIVEKHRDSMDSSAADVASHMQFPGQERVEQFRERNEEEPAYVTMKPAKLSLPNLENYFSEHKRPQMTKPLSLHDNPVDIGPAIELAHLKNRSRRDSVDIDSVVSDSEA